MFYQIYQI